MTNEQRTAIARIISDMIKADNIIEESEIRDMKELMRKYSLSRQNMSDARNMRFSEAVTILQELPRRDRQELFDCIYKVALSDNVCVPKEAMLLIALQYCLVDYAENDAKGGKMSRPYLVSCPTAESSISDQYMVYLESSYDEERNTEVKENFRLLVTQSRLYGFNFVYIPKMVEEFVEMDSHYVKDVINYMAPQLNEDAIEDVYNRLCNITTKEFFHSVLYEKLKVKVAYNAKPSVLINIGTSIIPYCALDGSVQYYTEFLCIPITTSTLDLVEKILDFYKSKVTVRTITVTDNRYQFKYFGFYKALFDFLIAPPPIAPDLVFLGQDMADGKYYISFKFGEGKERRLSLTPTQYQMYYQIVEKTYKSVSKGLPTAQVSNRTTICRLKGSIMEALMDVSFVDLYKPEKVGNVYTIRLDKNKVFVRKPSNDHKTFIDVLLV